MKLARVYSGEFSWGGSLFLKLAFLGLGVGFVYWAGWPQPSIPPVSVPSTRQSGILSADTIHSGPAGLAPVAVDVAPLSVKGASQSIDGVGEKAIGRSGGVKASIVDLNDGTSAEFKILPGIGAVLAGRIIAHRASHGAFRRVEDLVLVPGIGKKRFQQLRPFVTVRVQSSGMAVNF